MGYCTILVILYTIGYIIPYWLHYTLLVILYPIGYIISYWLYYTLLAIVYPIGYIISYWLYYTLLVILYHIGYFIPYRYIRPYWFTLLLSQNSSKHLLFRICPKALWSSCL